MNFYQPVLLGGQNRGIKATYGKYSHPIAKEFFSRIKKQFPRRPLPYSERIAFSSATSNYYYTLTSQDLAMSVALNYIRRTGKYFARQNIHISIYSKTKSSIRYNHRPFYQVNNLHYTRPRIPLVQYFPKRNINGIFYHKIMFIKLGFLRQEPFKTKLPPAPTFPRG